MKEELEVEEEEVVVIGAGHYGVPFTTAGIRSTSAGAAHRTR